MKFLEKTSTFSKFTVNFYRISRIALTNKRFKTQEFVDKIYYVTVIQPDFFSLNLGWTVLYLEERYLKVKKKC